MIARVNIVLNRNRLLTVIDVVRKAPWKEGRSGRLACVVHVDVPPNFFRLIFAMTLYVNL